MFRYLLTMIASIAISWITSPYYLSRTTSVNGMVAKVAVFLIVWLVLSLLVRKRSEARH